MPSSRLSRMPSSAALAAKCTCRWVTPAARSRRARGAERAQRPHRLLARPAAAVAHVAQDAARVPRAQQRQRGRLGDQRLVDDVVRRQLAADGRIAGVGVAVGLDQHAVTEPVELADLARDEGLGDGGEDVGEDGGAGDGARGLRRPAHLPASRAMRFGARRERSLVG